MLMVPPRPLPNSAGCKIRLNLELGDGIGARQDRRLIIVCRVVVDAIQEKVIVLNAVAVDSDQKILIEGVVSLRDVCAGRERNQLNEVPSVQAATRRRASSRSPGRAMSSRIAE